MKRDAWGESKKGRNVDLFAASSRSAVPSKISLSTLANFLRPKKDSSGPTVSPSSDATTFESVAPMKITTAQLVATWISAAFVVLFADKKSPALDFDRKIWNTAGAKKSTMQIVSAPVVGLSVPGYLSKKTSVLMTVAMGTLVSAVLVRPSRRALQAKDSYASSLYSGDQRKAPSDMVDALLVSLRSMDAHPSAVQPQRQFHQGLIQSGWGVGDTTAPPPTKVVAEPKKAQQSAAPAWLEQHLMPEPTVWSKLGNTLSCVFTGVIGAPGAEQSCIERTLFAWGLGSGDTVGESEYIPKRTAPLVPKAFFDHQQFAKTGSRAVAQRSNVWERLLYAEYRIMQHLE